MGKSLLQNRWAALAWEVFLCVVGRFMFSFSVNVLITPLNLYSVGFTGIAQLLRTFCISVLHVQTPAGLDLTGIIFWLLNIPVLILAWFGIGRRFFCKTLFIIVISSLFMTLLPVPAEPLLDDTLTMCILGGVIAGLGAGLALSAGGSGGGQDVIGVYLSKKNPNMSVGIVSIAISLLVYAACLIYFDVQVLVYSLIYSTITSISLDKVHYQNIKIRVEIETGNPEMRERLSRELNRNVMAVEESGGDSAAHYRLELVITKTEKRAMLRAVHAIDPEAFIIMDENIQVNGRFAKPIA